MFLANSPTIWTFLTVRSQWQFKQHQIKMFCPSQMFFVCVSCDCGNFWTGCNCDEGNTTMAMPNLWLSICLHFVLLVIDFWHTINGKLHLFFWNRNRGKLQLVWHCCSVCGCFATCVPFVTMLMNVLILCCHRNNDDKWQQWWQCQWQ